MSLAVGKRQLWLFVAAAALTAVLIGLAGCDKPPSDKPAPGPYTVAEVFDGDSFNLRAANGSIVRVRIAGIDAPEKTQPYSAKAKASLESLLSSGPIGLEVIKQDTFDRWIAHVRIAERDLGLEQIAAGYAWFFRRYKKDLNSAMQERYAQAEEDARAARLGLWAGIAASASNPALAPEPPWKFRERSKKENKSGG
jgi:endonuclease YncB( thermonuclease family)